MKLFKYLSIATITISVIIFVSAQTTNKSRELCKVLSTLVVETPTLSVSVLNSIEEVCPGEVLIAKQFTASTSEISIIGKAIGSVDRDLQYSVTYANVQSITLDKSHIKIFGEGSAGCVVSIKPSLLANTRIVNIARCQGNGPVSFAIAAGSAIDSNGDPLEAFEPSSAGIIYNAGIDTVENIVKLSNQTYVSNDQSYKYDVYLPSEWSTKAKMPSLILVHGGGWVVGDKNDYAKLAESMSKLGIVVFVPNYLSEKQAPDGITNIHNFVLEIIKQPDIFNIDLSRLSIGGTSAGGHLVLNELSNSPDTFMCVIANAPPVDLLGAFLDTIQFPISSQIVENAFGKNHSTIKSYSPIENISSIGSKTKIVIFQEKLDNLVPFKYTEKYINALKSTYPAIDITASYSFTDNPYFVNPTEEQLTHLYTDEEENASFKSYFYAKCM